MYYKNLAEKLIKHGVTAPKIPIVIPSYNRLNAPALKWANNTSNQSLTVYCFVRAYQLDEYKKKYPKVKFIPLHDVSNIGETRKAIMEWCLDNGIYRAFQLDDDVTGVDYMYPHINTSGKTYMRQSHLNEGRSLHGVEPVAFAVWEKQIKLIEKKHSVTVALGSIPVRGFSWVMREENYHLNSDIPIQCIYINYKALNDSNVHYHSSDEVGWEDLAIAVQAIEAGLACAHIYGITYSSPPMCKTSGGCNGDNAEVTCMERTKRLSSLFMTNVAKGNTAFYTKDLKDMQVVRCHFERLK